MITHRMLKLRYYISACLFMLLLLPCTAQGEKVMKSFETYVEFVESIREYHNLFPHVEFVYGNPNATTSGFLIVVTPHPECASTSPIKFNAVSSSLFRVWIWALAGNTGSNRKTFGLFAKNNQTLQYLDVTRNNTKAFAIFISGKEMEERVATLPTDPSKRTFYLRLAFAKNMMATWPSETAYNSYYPGKVDELTLNYLKSPQNPVDLKLTAQEVESTWTPDGDNEFRDRHERHIHGVSSHGHAGYFIKTSFTRTYRQAIMPISVAFSFSIEKDAGNPIYPIGGGGKVIRWGDLVPLQFKVNGQNEIDYSWSENDDALPHYTQYIVKRNNWLNFEIFVPWELFHLWDIRQDIKDLQANVFLRAEVYDAAGRWLGENSNIPIYVYKRTQGYTPDIQNLGTMDLSSLTDDDDKPRKPVEVNPPKPTKYPNGNGSGGDDDGGDDDEGPGGGGPGGGGDEKPNDSDSITPPPPPPPPPTVTTVYLPERTPPPAYSYPSPPSPEDLVILADRILDLDNIDDAVKLIASVTGVTESYGDDSKLFHLPDNNGATNDLMITPKRSKDDETETQSHAESYEIEKVGLEINKMTIEKLRSILKQRGYDRELPMDERQEDGKTTQTYCFVNLSKKRTVGFSIEKGAQGGFLFFGRISPM